MSCRRQYWRETATHLWVRILEVWYGAWQKFGWEKNTAGIGVAVEMIEAAARRKKKIGVEIIKYPARYEITPRQALKYGVANTFVARDRRPLYIIPETAFRQVQSK